ncbi:M1-specific T cell receptor alpha chain-like isoform X4 [Misgurnus anguillicaudatus]|uniref:M1-specific T cell receptor alpha chain-like isoform X4 n=1 Tax=Misgurnus anguillicaudatus TaxID=75329 RepID=UPI003CCF09D2
MKACFCWVVCKCVNDGTRKIHFGKGTILYIQSKEEVPPSIYKVNETSCLATDFTRHDAVDSDPAFTDQNVTVRYKGESTYSAFALGTGDQCIETGTCTVGSSNHQNAIESDEKMNFMSLGIFWLRILFVKTVVFNVLMTFKAWMG